MKLLHVADLHQGRTTWSTIGPDGIPSAVASVARCWKAAVDVANEREVDLVLVAGDVFDKRNPNALEVVLFAEALEELVAPALIIPGNHDAGSPSILEVFDRRDGWAPRHRVSTRPEVFEMAGLRIGSLPWTPKSRLMAEGLRSRAADQEAGRILEGILAEFAENKVDVVVGHWSIVGSVLGDSELDVSIIDEPLIHPEALEPFRYAAFGHLHKCQPINESSDRMGRIHGYYAGSIDRMSFSEEHDTKVVLEVDLEEPSVRTHPMPARSFITFEQGDPTPREVEGAIVRIHGEDAWAEEFGKACRREGASIVAVQADRPFVKATIRDVGMTEALSPREALARWLDLRETEAGLKNRTLQRAEAILGDN
jgi:DNA repair protein SbcD/Mre11